MKISIIGAGAMGGAMVEGFAKGSMINAEDITVAAPHHTTLQRFEHLGVSLTTDNKTAAACSDMVAVVVKPWLVEQVIKEIKSVLDYQKQLVMVVAAGISGADVSTWLDKGDGSLPPVFLIMPNTAIAVKSSMTFIVPVNAKPAHIQLMTDLFVDTGGALVIAERQLTAGMVLASCGIAYAMRYIRAATEGGVQLGFKAADAQYIVEQTVKGAVDLLQANESHPEAEIDKVTTPGGVTIRGLNAMEQAGFTNAVIQGLVVSAKK